MNETLTLSFNHGSSDKSNGLNKYDLLQTVSEDVKKAYGDIFDKVEGSLTTVSDNDTSQKIKVAIVTLQPYKVQLEILLRIQEAFSAIENNIDPTRLQFTITKAMDDEICINRNSDFGLSKIIINEDGIVIRTFTAYRNITSSDEFEVYEHGVNDYEHLAYKFFSV